ncbi:MAG: spore coat protein [Bacilli bacterium]|nr:spore coat protein [Bacilli bacterium]
MNDKLLYEAMLLILKSNMEVYVHGTLESSNEDVREVIQYGLETTLKLQKDLYNKMTEFGWYQIQNVETKAIKQTLKKVTQN